MARSYLAEGLMSGFEAGMSAAEKRADRKLRTELAEKKMLADLQEMGARRVLEAEANDARLRSDAEKMAREEADPRNVLARTKAQRELDALNNPPAPSEADSLRGEVDLLKLRKERDALNAPSPMPAPPMAKVTQAFGEGGQSKASYEMPVSDLQKTLGGIGGANGYKSPYAADLADIGRQIADHQAQIDSGDARTGLFNFRARQSMVDGLKRRQMYLGGQELKDMLGRGAIDQAEADRRANVLLQNAGFGGGNKGGQQSGGMGL